VWRYRLAEFWQSLSAAAAKLMIFRLNSGQLRWIAGKEFVLQFLCLRHLRSAPVL
jgi:hypothetical protein